MKYAKQLMPLPGLLALLFSVSSCGQQEAEPPAAGSLPEVEGRLLGPQPGPDRAIPKATNPFGQEPDVLAVGRRLFIWFNCYGCHGGRAGGGMGPSLRDAAWMYGSTDQDIFNSIAEGRPHGMPAWGTTLPEVEIWKIVAYIKSMGTELEPEAPPQNPVYPNPPPRRDIRGVQAGGGQD